MPTNRKSLGRILCVTSNLARWEGDSTTPFVLNLAADLQELGWQIDLLAPHAPGAASKETLAGVNVERFRYLWPASQQTVCYQGGAMINLRRNPLNKLKLPALVAMELAAVSRRLAMRDYDLLHSHWILPQGFTGMLASQVLRTPHVITVHGGDIFGLRGKLMSRLKRASLARADAVTVNSSFTESAVSQLSPDLQRLERIPMGVAVKPLSKSQKQHAVQIGEKYRRAGGPLLLFIGRIVEEKGLQDLLSTVGLLRRDLPETTLLILGEGQERAEMEALSESLGVDDQVHFAGWVDSESIPTYLAAADIFVGPSRRAPDGWVEAQGLTFLEAMAAGTPVIASRLGGILDSVTDGETGLLVEERSPQQIADAVRRLLDNPQLAENIAENASRKVRSRFSRAASAGDFSTLFRDLITQSKM